LVTQNNAKNCGVTIIFHGDVQNAGDCSKVQGAVERIITKLQWQLKDYSRLHGYNPRSTPGDVTCASQTIRRPEELVVNSWNSNDSSISATFDVNNDRLFLEFKKELFQIVTRKEMSTEEKFIDVKYENGSTGLNIIFRSPSDSNSILTISDLADIEDELRAATGEPGKPPYLWGKTWAEARAAAGVSNEKTIQIHTYFDFNLNQISKLSLEIAIPRGLCKPEGWDKLAKNLPTMIKGYETIYGDSIGSSDVCDYIKILKNIRVMIRPGSIKAELVYDSYIPRGLRFILKCLEYVDKDVVALKSSPSIPLLSIEASGIENRHVQYLISTDCSGRLPFPENSLARVGFNLLHMIYKDIPDLLFTHAAVSRMFSDAARINRAVLLCRRTFTQHHDSGRSIQSLDFFLDEINGGNCLVRSNTFMNAAASALKKGMGLTKISCLDMTSCRIGMCGAKLLGNLLGICPSLCRLQLLDNRLTSAGCEIIISSLEHNTVLSRLGLGSNELKPQVMSIMGQRRLQVLDLSDNEISDDGLEFWEKICLEQKLGPGAIRRALSSKFVAVLCLRMNFIGDAGALALAKILSCFDFLESCDIAFNRIHDIGAKSILDSIWNKKIISKIDFRKNYLSASFGNVLGEFGKQVIHDWVYNDSRIQKNLLLNGVKVCAVKCNHGTDSSFKFVWESSLDLSFKYMGSPEVVMLACLLHNTPEVSKLNLRWNSVAAESSADSELLCTNALKSLCMLRDVDISDNPYTSSKAQWSTRFGDQHVLGQLKTTLITLDSDQCTGVTQLIYLHVQGKGNHFFESYFRLPIKSQLGMVMEYFCKQHRISCNNNSFVFNGAKLQLWSTPLELQMVDHDQIDCIQFNASAACNSPEKLRRISETEFGKQGPNFTSCEDIEFIRGCTPYGIDMKKFGPCVKDDHNYSEVTDLTESEGFSKSEVTVGDMKEEAHLLDMQLSLLKNFTSGVTTPAVQLTEKVKIEGNLTSAACQIDDHDGDGCPFTLNIIDPLFPSRGQRTFLYDGLHQCFNDMQDKKRRVRFRFIHDDPSRWRKSGNVHIGKQVLRFFHGEGEAVERLAGILTGWLPKEESNFIDPKTNSPAPLWKVLLDPDRLGTGQTEEEDLEEHEILDARAAWVMKDGLSVFKTHALLTAAPLKGVLFWKHSHSYEEVVIQWEGSRAKTVKLTTLLQTDEIRVAAEEGLWDGMLLHEFMSITVPYPFLDCINVR
jgi:hypothetical protein